MGYLKEYSGTYGSSRIKCTVYVYEKNGGLWYAVDGSINVNFTYDHIANGVYVEELSDSDTFTASKPIDSLETLESECDD